jgi:hypothetical protein
MPKMKRFNFEPRYYDPIKEDVKNRTQRISNELANAHTLSRHDHLRHAFSQRTAQNNKAGFMQLLLATIFLGTFVGWLYFGNVALFAFAALFPLYIYLKTRKFFQ